MPSTHLSLHYHAVFSTKERAPAHRPGWRTRLYEYIGGAIRDSRGHRSRSVVSKITFTCLSAQSDSVHRHVIREIKKASTAWIRDEVGTRSFHWQDGYGAFTVSRSNLLNVADYIRTQEEHHRKRTFREEYVAFLKRHGIEYNERYLW